MAKSYIRKGRKVRGYATRRKTKTLNFKTKEGYKKWIAYGHIHGVFKKHGHTNIKIRGKAHKVIHTK